jgi:hypothetical protein
MCMHPGRRKIIEGQEYFFVFRFGSTPPTPPPILSKIICAKPNLLTQREERLRGGKGSGHDGCLSCRGKWGGRIKFQQQQKTSSSLLLYSTLCMHSRKIDGAFSVDVDWLPAPPPPPDWQTCSAVMNCS